MSTFRYRRTLDMRILVLIAVLTGLGLENAEAQTGPTIIYDDGGSHVLAEDIANVIVTNDSMLVLQASVEVVDVNNGTLVQNLGDINGRIEFEKYQRGLIVRDGAHATVTSGSVFGIEVDAAKLVMDGARIQFFDCDTINIKNGSELDLISGTVSAADPGCSGVAAADSRVHIDGANVVGIKTFRGTSEVIISSGYVSNVDQVNVYARDTTSLSVTGGNLEASHDNAIWLTDFSKLRLSGGVVHSGMSNGIYATDAATIEMTGGVVSSRENVGISLAGASRLSVTGGEITVSNDFDATHIFAMQDSAITIYGSDFNLPMFEPVTSLEGKITGTLADGSPIEWDFRRQPTATITLVPEPCSEVLLLVGMLALVRRRQG